ncbi:MAG: RNA pseudouridine synthase [Treponema sp.]|nr:RNA pseudouridine synthase [Treponema sp.]
MSALSVSVLHEPTAAEPFLVLDKPSGLPSAPLHEGDDSALTQALSLFPDIASVSGRKTVERGLVHRIDTATRGCVLIASTQESYDFFLQMQAEGGFIKNYEAKVDTLSSAEIEKMMSDGFPSPPMDYSALAVGKTITVESRFRGYGSRGASVRPVTENACRAALKKSSPVLYRTTITLQDKNTALCRISAGYRHQVRCHLAWLGLPVKNDSLYNPLCQGNADELLAFTAVSLEFFNPLDKRAIRISL